MCEVATMTPEEALERLRKQLRGSGRPWIERIVQRLEPKGDLGRALSAPCACEELLDALIWCSGSQDFGPGGMARKGWLKKCKPLLDRLLPTEETP